VTPALGCQTTEFAGFCLGIPPTNAVLATLLFATAAILFDRYRLEVRADE
jgi:hypothetical protein